MKNLIKKAVRETFSRFVFYTGIFHLWRFRKKNEITILNYHNISGKDFESHIKELLKYYKIISLEECVDCLKNQNNIEYGIVITFDDGYESFYSDIFPTLIKYKIPAIVFLTTDFVDTPKLFWFDMLEIITEEKSEAFFTKYPQLKGLHFDHVAEHFKRYDGSERERIISEFTKNSEELYAGSKWEKYRILNWEQIKEMRESGFVTFGAHTLSHPILSKIPLSQARKEISESRKIIETKLQTTVRYFAYPNGDAPDFNESTIKILEESGFECALTTINGNCVKGENLFTLKRKAVDSKFNRYSLLAKISGLWVSLSRKGI